MSNRLSLIIKREYLSIVGKKSFLLTVVLLPLVIIVLCAVVPILLAQVKSDEKKVVAVVDESAGGHYAALFEDDEDFRFVALQPAEGESLYDCFLAADGALYAIVQIPADVEQTAALTIYSTQAVSGNGLRRRLARSLEPELSRRRVESYGIDSLAEIIAACDVHVHISSLQWDERGGETLSSSDVALALSGLLAFAAYLFVISFAAMILTSVAEEKTNRIVEVVLSCCKPLELMFGKMIAIALVGLTQYAIWGAMLLLGGLFLGLTVALGDVSAAADLQADNAMVREAVQMLGTIDFGPILLCFLLYGIGGYLLYASICAALGSLADTASDAAQYVMPIMLIGMFALYAGIFSMENPDGPLAWWCSLIPFTSPIVMMVRLPYDVPLYEILLSLVLLYGTAFGILSLSARIFRAGILMYGRKFKLKDILVLLRRG